MTDLEKLTKSLKKLSGETIEKLLESVVQILSDERDILIPACPYYGSTDVIRYGYKCS